MEFTTVLFYVFSAILVLAAIRVITDSNPVHAALFLVLSFCSAAALWMLLKAEFLSIVLILVYVGAVMVLFLFVVMMVDIKLTKVREGFWGYLPLAATIGVVIVLEMAAVLFRGFWRAHTQVPDASAMIGNTKELGKLIYTQYLYAFEIAALLLLVAIVAAVALTMRKRKDTKYFAPGDAVKVKSGDRLRIVKMKADSTRDNGDGQPAAAPAAEQK
ncbi:NADH-quinone oxidoreductase subunit J [Herminiimonas arsenitoxidans]|uniref:NADH-quinone oxidoreductase subunit J n=1 Tax=Herminiimonas arsenitoxidans TaxID=1809410 RepID=UPI000970E14E|nr:NADH-quinone oxidoreductase subunit J [Herminiimonas arsenitoxidans]